MSSRTPASGSKSWWTRAQFVLAAHELHQLPHDSGFEVAVGAQNLFDKNPPQTNHNGYNGYLTSSVDVLGRAYRVTAEYKF